MVVVEIAGKKGAGKTYLASLLTYKLANMGYRVYKTSFASTLKRLIAKAGLTKVGIKHYVNWPDFWGILQQEGEKLIGEAGYKGQTPVICFRQAFSTHFDKLKKGYELAFLESKVAEGYRVIAQTLGTEIFRYVDEGFWVKLTVKEIKKVEPVADFVIIDDYRFTNENLKDYFEKVFAIKIVTPNDDNSDQHQSEKEVENVYYDLEVVRKENTYYPNLNVITAFVVNQ